MHRHPMTSPREVLRQHPELRRGGWKQIEIDPAFRETFPACRNIARFIVDRTYSVQVYELDTAWGRVDHLLVRRHDEAPVRQWYDLQRIKDELTSPDRIAVEVFPKRGDLRDSANIYHLWVLPEGFNLPFGMHLPGGGMR